MGGQRRGRSIAMATDDRCAVHDHRATLRAAADGLQVDMPAWADPMTYGPPPSADGEPTIYLYDWNPETRMLERREG
jgi:hypothetical protein